MISYKYMNKFSLKKTKKQYLSKFLLAFAIFSKKMQKPAKRLAIDILYV